MPDPDKMGSGIFHYYNYGLFLRHSDGTFFSADDKTIEYPMTHDTWDIEWFTKLGSHKSIKRTVILDGYPDIHNGTYSCDFTYSGPINIEKSERILSDGRLWIGEIYSSTVEFNIDT